MPAEFGLAPTPKSGHLSQDGDVSRLAVYTEQYVTKGTRFLPFEGTVRLGRFQLEPFLPEHDVSNICIVDLSRQEQPYFVSLPSICIQIQYNCPSATVSNLLLNLNIQQKTIHSPIGYVVDFKTNYFPSLFDYFRQLRVCLCRAPSLTRGRVCNLQCNHASSI
jgi:hypothetical protein